MWEVFTGTIYETIRPSQGCNFDVTFLEAAHGRFVVKTGDTPEKIAALEREATVLSALTAHQPAAPGFVARDGDQFLFTYIPGEDLSSVVQAFPSPADRERLAEDEGRFLRTIHAWTPLLPRPADWLTDALIRCTRNVESGAEGCADIHSAHYGRTNAELLDYLNHHRAEHETEIVFGHGDWCLPNVLADDAGRVTGAVDWGDGGYADYRYDLATGLWTLRRNVGDDPNIVRYLAAFLRGYGYPGSVESLAYFEAIYALL